MALNGRTVGSQRTGDALPWPARGGSDVKKLLLLVSVAALSALLVSSQEDIRRYLKMRSM